MNSDFLAGYDPINPEVKIACSINKSINLNLSLNPKAKQNYTITVVLFLSVTEMTLAHELSLSHRR
jgi:hypothetical protein